MQEKIKSLQKRKKKETVVRNTAKTTVSGGFRISCWGGGGATSDADDFRQKTS